MRAAKLYLWSTLTLVVCVGCSHKSSSTPQQAQAPPLQTGKGTLSTVSTAQPQIKSDSPLASPLPQPPQNVPLPPPPTPKKVRHKTKPAPKPVETAQATPNTPSPASPATAMPVSERVPTGAGNGAASPIGQLTTGDSATELKTRRETADIIGGTQQGLNSLRRNLSNEEKVTATQIRTFLKQAQQALDNGDTEGAHGLATKAKQLLDELTQP